MDVLNLKLFEKSISLFKNLLDTKPVANISVHELYSITQNPFLKEEIEHLREAKDKKGYNQIKLKYLPAVTLSGIFKERKTDAFVKHSGLMQIDIDNLEDVKPLLEKLKRDPFTTIAFVSPGGKGIKLVVKILPEATTHKDQFRALEKYYQEKYGVTIDKSCKDLSRPMLLSYDPNAILNQNAKIFTEKLKVEKKIVSSENKEIPKTKYARKTTVAYRNNNERTVANITHAIEDSGTDITSEYINWIKIGFALCNALGETGREYYHRIGQYYPNYTFEETETKYAQLLSYGGSGTTLGTLVYFAKQHGVIPGNILVKTPVKPIRIDKEKLKKQLKKLRYELARKEDTPAFFIFYNSTLDELLERQPKTLNELQNISGFGKYKVEKYGNEIVNLIKNYS